MSHEQKESKILTSNIMHVSFNCTIVQLSADYMIKMHRLLPQCRSLLHTVTYPVYVNIYIHSQENYVTHVSI